MIKAGLYLNEENGQTFKIADISEIWAYVRFPDFFFNNAVHADELLTDITQLLTANKITYIGEV